MMHERKREKRLNDICSSDPVAIHNDADVPMLDAYHLSSLSRVDSIRTSRGCDESILKLDPVVRNACARTLIKQFGEK